MILQTQKPSHTAHAPESLQALYNWLLFVKESATNNMLMRTYFLTKFVEDPHYFLDFLFFLNTQLQSSAQITSYKKHLAKKCLAIICPLCERFGFSRQRNLLNDICFQVINSKKYNEINRLLKKYKNSSEKIIQDISHILQQLLEKHKYRFQLEARYKNIYSIYCKMEHKGKEHLFQLNDIFGFRIIMESDESEQCFGILNLLHDRFTPLPERFKDYITIPKINGYQSLHTGITNILPELDMPIEVQIRTKSMAEFAEKGTAAHWEYKESKNKPVNKQHAVLHTITASQGKGERKDIYFFSYVGDIFHFPAPLTIKEFATKIHTDLGKSATSALVNDQQQALSYEISEGDIIQICK